MFQLKRKQLNTQTHITNNNCTHRKSMNFKCRVRPRTPRIVWIILTVLSAGWIAAMASLFYILLLPEIGYDIPIEGIIFGAVLLWLILVLSVRNNIKHLNVVDCIIVCNNLLTIKLVDGKNHSYNMDDITVNIKKMKRIDKDDLVDSKHFNLIVKGSRQKIKYDILVEDSDEFIAFISRIRN